MLLNHLHDMFYIIFNYNIIEFKNSNEVCNLVKFRE